ncbi:hypothetical protein BKA70DRAFT_1224260 [Coprinopsis sp. MPI-PUGE-AT-0042]|nr:hypothetical protein BKA70DRAFT_1224260 [Coprinopsis sp. MPI-PUGE-AT-0042]
MNKDVLTAIYTSQTKATNMAATLLTPSVHLNAVHIICEDKPDELWETLAPNSTHLSLWSVVTCRIPVETEEAVMFTNPTTLQPTSTGGPAVVQSQPKCEEWKVMHMFPKGTPSIRIGMRVEMQDSFKDGAHQLETICLRVGTITRVWKREVNWLHYVVDLTTAVNFRIGENSMRNDVLGMTRITLAVPRRLTAFDFAESVHLLLNRHNMEDGAFWASAKGHGRTRRGEV